MRPRLALPLLLLVASCGHHAAAGGPFALEWRGVDTSPTSSPAVSEGMKHYTFHVEPFVDKRPDPTKVGSIEGTNEPVHSNSNVAAFCTQQFITMLTQAGVKVVDSGATASLQPELVVYDVVEGGLFNGDVRVRFTLLVKGKVVYEATLEGKSKRWGRSRSPDNYNEALSNALREATQQLLQDETFGKAMTSTATGASTASASKI